MEARPDNTGLVQGRHAEIDRLRLIIHSHVKRSSTRAAESPVSEAARRDAMHGLLPGGEHIVLDGYARENHGRGAAAQLAGATVAPAHIERFARQPEADGSAQASASPVRHENGLSCGSRLVN